MRIFYVVHESASKQWVVKENGIVLSKFPLKENAVKDGRTRANNAKGELRVGGLNGQFMTEWTYGKDPYPPKG